MAEPEVPPFNLLPPEIMEKIFKFVGSKIEIQEFRKVQRYWDNIVRGMFEITLLLNNETWEECILSQGEHLNVNLVCCTLPFNLVCKLNFLRRIKSLIFGVHHADYGIIPLLRQCVNLETLEIGDSILKFPDYQTLREFNWSTSDPCRTLPALKTFILATEDIGTRDENIFIKSLLPFLVGKDGVGKLEKIELQGFRLRRFDPSNIFKETWPMPENDVRFRHLSIFLIRKNLGTLKELVIKGHWVERVRPDNSVEPLLSETRIYFKNGSVTGIEQNNDRSIHNWWSVLQYMKTVEYINVVGLRSSLMPGIHKVICKNATALERIRVADIYVIGEADSEQAEIDMETFDNEEGEEQGFEEPFDNLKISQIENYEMEDGRYVKYLSYHGFIKDTYIPFLPLKIRYLKLMTTLEIEDFCPEYFERLETVVDFKFAGVPWFRIAGEKIFFINEDHIRDLILWLPNLKILALSRFPVHDTENNVYLPSIPDDTIDWIEETSGLRIMDEIEPFDPITPEEEYDCVNIKIKQKFRVLQNQRTARSTLNQLSCPSL